MTWPESPEQLEQADRQTEPDNTFLILLTSRLMAEAERRGAAMPLATVSARGTALARESRGQQLRDAVLAAGGELSEAVDAFLKNPRRAGLETLRTANAAFDRAWTAEEEFRHG